MCRGKMRASLCAVFVVGVLLLETGAMLLVPLIRAQAAETTLTGTIGVIYAHPLPGTRLPVRDTRYYLTDAARGRTELLIDEGVLRASGGLAALANRQVNVTVLTAVGPLTAGNAPLTATAIQPQGGPRPHATVTGAQAYVNLLCKFNDVVTEPEPVSYFNTLMGNGANALGPYWNEVSYGIINISGSATYGWFTLPQPKVYYLVMRNGQQEFDADKFRNDCTTVASPTVNFNPYVGINMMFNETVANYALGGYGELTLSGTTRQWGTTWLVPWAYHIETGNPYSGPATMAHEMGHAFALGHSADPQGVTYKNAWDVMSGGDEFCPDPHITVFGCTGQHLIANDKNFLGWIPGNRRATFGAVTRSFKLSALQGGSADGNLIAVIPGPDSQHYTTVEMRRRTGFDTRLPGDAVIIHTVDATRKDPAWVQGTNGGAGAMFIAGQTYTISGTATTVRVAALNATDATVVISNGIAPSVSGLSATSGYAPGGASVTISGTNLSPEATVTFGSTPATNIVANGNGTLTVTTPALAPGTYPVTVTNPDSRAGTGPGYLVSAAVRVAPDPRSTAPSLATPAANSPPRLTAPTPVGPTPTPLPAPTRR